VKGKRLVPLCVIASVAVACGGTAKHTDPPVLVLWKRMGDVRLGELLEPYATEYGPAREHRIHGGLIDVESNFDMSGRINWIYFTTPYYRTKRGFGVGSRFPRAWRKAFLWNGIVKDKPCNCWVKVGRGARSLPASGTNFGKPWVIVDMSHGRVSGILMSSKYLD
jgi:hypothetical protein